MNKRKILAVTKVSDKSTIHIPKEAMKLLGLRNGDRIIWTLEGGKIMIRKA